MNQSIEYRIARLYFLHDLITQIANAEPQLINDTDWNTNTDAINQMIELIQGESNVS
jgi:hypothetical protein